MLCYGLLDELLAFSAELIGILAPSVVFLSHLFLLHFSYDVVIEFVPFWFGLLSAGVDN